MRCPTGSDRPSGTGQQSKPASPTRSARWHWRTQSRIRQRPPIAAATFSRKDEARGLAGFVTDACVRDGSVLRSFGLPVFSAGLSIRGTVKESLGSVNHPIVIGGLNVRPGDVLVGDDDGLVLVACEDIGNAARLSRERDAKEAMMMESLRNGGDVLELTGIGQKLAQKGCTFEA